MKEYETIFITHPDQPETNVAAITEKVEGLIKKQGGHLFFSQNMGKKSLAYPIQKQTKGLYTCLDYAGEGEIVSEIEKVMRFDETVMRFLTVVKNGEVDVEARKAEIQKKSEELAAKPAEENA